MNWKESDLTKKGLKTNIKPHTKAVAIPESTPAGLLHIINNLKNSKIPYYLEYKFLDDRRFKFDVAVFYKNIKIAIEYEGLSFRDPEAKSGHTTLVGYTSNCTKYNLAVIEGWRLLRYTAMNYRSFNEDFNKLIKKHA